MKQLPVTGTLNKLLRQEFPEVFREERYIRLLHHLLFPTTVDEGTRLPLIPRYLLAGLEEKAKPLSAHRYTSSEYLKAFNAAIGGQLKVREYRYSERKARAAELVIGEALAQAVEDEMCQPVAEKLVNLLTGKPIKKSILRAEKAKWIATRQERAQDDSSPAAEAAAWLNTVPSQAFTLVKENLPTAMAAAKEIQDPAKRRANLGTLFRMASLSVVPIYKTTPNTPRMYTEGSTAASLSSGVRKALFGARARGKATFHGDLVAAQLAILAHIWNLSATQALLRDNMASKTVWPAFLEAVGLPDTGQNKSHLKRFVYATAFGMDFHALRWQALKDFGKQTVQRLWPHEVVQELLQGRETRRKQLQESRGFTDPFGIFRSLDAAAAQKSNGKAIGQEQAEKMLMAYEAQAYEFALMQPFITLAKKTKEFRILFWLHDGVYFRITELEPARQERYLDNLTADIGETATALGITTELDIERI